MSAREVLDNNLPVVTRVITDHDASGKAIFSSKVPDDLSWQSISDARFCLSYATNQIPVDMNNSKDLQTYSDFLENKPGIMIPGGTVLRYVDFMPGSLSPMHRTTSLDYGVVVEGEIELILDSGEVKLLHRGDIAVQRGTNHAWRNASTTEWARMLYVLQEAEPVKVDGVELHEDYGGGIEGVKPSRG